MLDHQFTIWDLALISDIAPSPCHSHTHSVGWTPVTLHHVFLSPEQTTLCALCDLANAML